MKCLNNAIEEPDRYEEYCQREDEKYLEQMDEAITKTDDEI